MSLTSFINNPNFQELRDKLKTVFPSPQFKLNNSLIAPPLTTNYSVVGQAFDYVLRFILEQRNKSKIKIRNSWIADKSYTMIEKKIEDINSMIIWVGYKRDIQKNRKEYLAILRTEYSMAKQNYQIFLNDGILTDSLIKSALFLARLDMTFRANFIDHNYGNESELDIKDVKQLASIINEDHFKVQNYCFINPTFGVGSRIVGGADADLIIDDTIIDIKVTKNLKFERDYLNQTIGYYILSLIGGVNKEVDDIPIKNIGIYFARHAVLWKISLSELADEKAILEFKEWFLNYADQKILGGQYAEFKKRWFAEKQAEYNKQTVNTNKQPKTKKKTKC